MEVFKMKNIDLNWIAVKSSLRSINVVKLIVMLLTGVGS